MYVCTLRKALQPTCTLRTYASFQSRKHELQLLHVSVEDMLFPPLRMCGLNMMSPCCYILLSCILARLSCSCSHHHVELTKNLLTECTGKSCMWLREHYVSAVHAAHLQCMACKTQSVDGFFRSRCQLTCPWLCPATLPEVPQDLL